MNTHDPTQLRKDTSSRRVGWVLLGIGIVVFPSGLLVPADTFAPFIPADSMIPFKLSAPLGAFIIYMGRRFLAKASTQQRLSDSRRPVLYLRPFEKDEKLAVYGWMFFGNLGITETREQALARLLEQVGPFVAIGRPSDSLPTLGAVRKYVQGEDWQDTVRDLVASSVLVVLQVGTTKGLMWEFQHILENVDPERLVLFHPSSATPWGSKKRNKEYAVFKESAEAISRCRLPEELGQCEFVIFSEDWVGAPCEAWAKSPWSIFRGWMSGSEIAHLREGLRPAFDQLGLPLPKHLWAPIEYVVVPLAVLVLLGAVVLVLS